MLTEIEDRPILLLAEHFMHAESVTIRALDEAAADVEVQVARNDRELTHRLARFGVRGDARRTHADVLLIDWDLPSLGALPLLRRMHTDPAYHRLPIIVLASRHDAMAEKQAYELGCRAYIVRGDNPTQYGRQLRQALLHWCDELAYQASRTE